MSSASDVSCVRVQEFPVLARETARESDPIADRNFSGNRRLHRDLNGLQSNRIPSRSLHITVDDGSVIDVMILYTSRVVDYLGSEEDVQAAISIALAGNNEIYANVGIDLVTEVNKRIEFEKNLPSIIKNVFKYNYYPSTFFQRPVNG